MRGTRWTGFWGVLAGVVAAAGPLEAATYKITWLLGHNNLDYFEEAAFAFKDEVEKGSGGDIAVDIKLQVPDEPGQVPLQVADLVNRGEAEMGHSFTDVMGRMDPRMYAFDAPYLFRSYRHLEGVFEGELGEELLTGLRKHGLVGLSFTYSGGANGIATIDRELRGPEDLKGLKVGVFGHRVNEAWLERLGAKAVPIGHDLKRILPMTRKGELDAVVTTWRNFDREDLGSEYGYLSLAGSTYLTSVTYINAAYFDGMPEKYRALLVKASKEAGRIERARTIQLNESAKRGMVQDKGIRPVYMSGAGQTRFERSLAQANEEIEGAIGKELVERIRATGDAEHPLIPAEFVRR